MNNSARRRRPSSSDSGKSNLSFEKLEVRKLLASVSLSGTELLIQGNPTDDTISLIGDASQSGFTVSVAGEPALTATYDYSDISSVTVFAGNGDDFVANTLQIPTIIHGEGGNDILRGGYADDVITGGNGNDEILGRSGNDQIDGQGGVDLVLGGTGDDIITGGVGDDNLQGDQGDDQIDGQGGNDLIDGGLGDDEILGGIGDDEIHGQDGLDFVSGGVGNDIISGGDGDDELQGNEGDDQINGQDGNDLIWGSFGDDTLNGGLGNDTIYGQDGIDSLIGSFGSDRLIGGQGDDILRGGDGRDILSGGAGDDELIGGSGDDDLFGQGGADVLSGNSGDDLLDAGFDQVQDTLTGGLGLDQFTVLGFIGSGSLDVVTDRAGFETYNGYSGPLTPLVEVDGDKLLIRGTETDDNIQISSVANQTQFRVTSQGHIIGDFPTAFYSEVVIEGNGGDDRIENINRSVIPMRVNGGDGNDTIKGGLSADVLNGGNGDDWIHGYDGDDQLNGDAGNDVIFGGNDLDTLLGGTGNDQLKGEHGDDTLRGEEGNDYLYGGNDDDTLFGEAGLDRIFGGTGDDILSGGTDDEDDQLFGESGLDEFFAVRGDEVDDPHETVEDPVAAQAQLVQEVTATELDDTQFDSFLDGLPAGASIETGGSSALGTLTIVNNGAQKLAYRNDGGSNSLLASYPVSFSTADIVYASEEIVSLQNDGFVQGLGDPTFSVVPVAALEGTVSLDSSFSHVVVASGSSSTAVLGGVNSSVNDLGFRTENVTRLATFQPTNSANVASNIAGLALGRGVADASSTLEILGQFQASLGNAGNVVNVVNQVFQRIAVHATVSSLLTQSAPASANLVPRPVLPTGVNAPAVGQFVVSSSTEPVNGQSVLVARLHFQAPDLAGIDEVGFVQILDVDDLDPNTGLFTNAINLQGEQLDRRDPNTGFFLDRSTGFRSPFYGVGNDGSSTINLADPFNTGANPQYVGQNFWSGNRFQTAIMSDAPTPSPGRRFSFEVHAIVTKGALAGTRLGKVSYTIDYSNLAATGTGTFSSSATSLPSDNDSEFIRAVQDWNDQTYSAHPTDTPPPTVNGVLGPVVQNTDLPLPSWDFADTDGDGRINLEDSSPFDARFN